MPGSPTSNIPIDWLLAAVSRVFAALELPHDASSAVARALVDADMRGIASHGVLLVPMYADRILAGSVSRATEARVLSEFGAIASLDADNALGILTGDQAMQLASHKARQFGIGAVSVRRAFHFGGAFRYVQAAAERGLVGIAAANTRPLMPAPGGAKAVVGNNPLAIGVPAGGLETVVLDMALSEAALGKIRLAAQEGRTIPSTWATDASGQATTDPETAIAGLLLPAAGPKGYGLAFMIDVLTGVLSGGSFGAGVQGLYADVATPNDCAHVFIAIDPAAFGDAAQFVAGVRTLSEQVASSPLAPGTERVLLPGQLEAERHRRALAEGLQLPESVLTALLKTADAVGAELPARDEGTT